MKAAKGTIPELEGLRAIAVIMVLVNHLNKDWLPGGFTGVDIFFVLSGYLVSRSFSRNGGESLSATLLSFYAKRTVRIFPALLVCCIVTSIASIVLIPEAWLSNSMETTASWATVGASNVALILTDDGYFAPRSEYNPFTQTWSLGVELQFYLVIPFLLALQSRGCCTGRVERSLSTWIITILTCASFILAGQWMSSSPNWAFYSIQGGFGS